MFMIIKIVPPETISYFDDIFYAIIVIKIDLNYKYNTNIILVKERYLGLL